MVIEHFKDGDAAAVYKRFADKGRMLPPGLKYLDNWVASSADRCFQLMETEEATLFETWIAECRDIVDFEVIPVVSSAETRSRLESAP